MKAHVSWTLQHHKTKIYTLFVGDGKKRKDCLLGEFIPCPPGSVVHCKILTENQAEFLITEVLGMWESFDADFHHSGAYVAWDKDHCIEDDKNVKGKGVKNSDGRNKRGKQKAAGKKSTGKSVRQKKETEEGIEVNETKKGKKRKANADRENVKEKSGEKKAKARKIRKVATKVTVGKNAAEKVREKNKAKIWVFEEDNELDYEEEEVEQQEDDSNDNEEMKREEEAKI